MEIIHVLLGKANPRGLVASNSLVNELGTQQALAKENVSVWGIDDSIIHDYPWRPFATLLFRKCLNPFRLDRKMVEALENRKGNAVFHLHGGWNSIFYSLAKALHRRNIPFVFTPQDSYPGIAFRNGQWIRRIYFQLFEKRILKYARWIHCLNRIEKEAVQIIYPNKKTILIPFGYEGFTKIKHDNYSRELVIGFSGQLDIYSKGLDILLKAFSIFNNHVPYPNYGSLAMALNERSLRNLPVNWVLPDMSVFGASSQTKRNWVSFSSCRFLHIQAGSKEYRWLFWKPLQRGFHVL